MTNLSMATRAILIVIGIFQALINPTSNLSIVLELAGIGFMIDGKE